MLYRNFLAFLLFLSPEFAFAGDVMFEGYYRIKLNGQHIGYDIQRYSFDPKTKTFENISFLRVKIGDDLIQESLKAKSDDRFQPVSFQYTSQTGDQLKSIDGTFKGQAMQLKKSDWKKTKTETYKIPKDTILSSFLVYVLLQKEMNPNKPPYKYSAVAEEEGNSYFGFAKIESVTKKNSSYSTVKIRNRFKNEEFYSTMTVIPDEKTPNKFTRGEVVFTDSEVKNLTTELVATPNLATEGQTVPNKILVTLFGNVPSGKLNLVAAPLPNQKTAEK